MVDREASQHCLLSGHPAKSGECGSEAAILAVERNDVAGGLWSTEKYGDLLQGDKRMAFAFVTGRVEVQQLRGLYKIAFKDITIVYRRTAEDGSKLPLNARVYLTKKKAKRRMADLEETSYVVPTPKTAGGYIGIPEATLGNFDLTLRDAPDDPRTYKGLVIAKPANEKPLTEEPIVFGYVRFIDDRPEIPTTENALGLNEYKDMLEKAQKHLLSTARVPAYKKWKSMSYYRRMARKAWLELNKVEEVEIEYDDFRRALDLLDVTMLEPRAIRIFEACDLDKSGRIGLTEFEIALMMNDGAPESGLTPQDAFKMFDIENSGRITKTGFSRVVSALDVSKRLPGKPDSEERNRAVDALFDVIDEDKSGEITYSEFRNAWVQLVDVDFELRRRGAIPAKIPPFLRIFGFAQRATLALNRHTLLSACANEEAAEQKAFDDTRQKVDELREKARRRRDERRRARAAEKNKLGMSSARDTALRNKERNARLQREQAARSRHRQEEKVLKNRLEAEKAGAKRRKDAQIRAQSIQKEEDRIRDIRAAGLDRLDVSMQAHKEVPRELYSNAAARERLADIVYADFGDNRLELLPADGFLMWLASLRYLRLSNNRLVTLPTSEIGKMGKLEILHVNRNELCEFPNSMGNLSQLRELDASMNRLTNLPIGFERLNRLESLRLASNNLTELPVGLFGSLIMLRNLELRRNKLFELPGDFHELGSLTRLDLHGNKLHKLPDQFGSLARLRRLDLSSNNLVSLPESMCELRSCEIFHLQENQLHALGMYIGGWKRAAFVNASDNRIAFVDKALGALHRLNDLRLNRNKCVKLPAEIGLTSQLARFDASANSLCQFPVELGAITLLHTVILRRNRINGIVPEELGFLCSVTELDLSYNDIEALPATISGLKEILDLNLAHNRLETLPDSISACQRLEKLSVAANRVKTIPLFLSKCRALRVLDLTSNVIAELPANLSQLTKITHIYLGKNRLRALPVEIVNLLDTVHEIHIDRNPLSELPPRWGRSGNSAHDRALWPSGYDNESAVQWVRDHAKFYDEALAEWEATGPLHVSGRASLSAFETAVKKRCGGAWEDYLIPFVRAYYFQARRTGNPPKFSHLSNAEMNFRKRTEMKANAIHAFRAARAKKEADLLNDIRQELYRGNLAERISTAEAISALRHNRAGLLQANARAALIEQTTVRAEGQQQREICLQNQRAAKELVELKALHQHLLDTCGEPADGSHFFPPIDGF